MNSKNEIQLVGDELRKESYWRFVGGSFRARRQSSCAPGTGPWKLDIIECLYLGVNKAFWWRNRGR